MQFSGGEAASWLRGVSVKTVDENVGVRLSTTATINAIKIHCGEKVKPRML